MGCPECKPAQKPIKVDDAFVKKLESAPFSVVMPHQDPEKRCGECGKAIPDCSNCKHEAPELFCQGECSPKEEAGKEAEIVICAAVRFNGKVWRGNRHPHAIAAMRDELSYTMTRKQMDEAKIDTEQGFVTSRNRYVDREEGLAIQKAAGIPCFRGEYSYQLYSEDLY